MSSLMITVEVTIAFTDVGFLIAELKQSEGYYEHMANKAHQQGEEEEMSNAHKRSVKCGRLARAFSDALDKMMEK